MDWKAIPSLASLRAFEATARSGSLAGAARELNVTEAAVRQHVRALETQFKVKLIKRDGRSVATTQGGDEFAAGLRRGFESLQAAVEQLQTSGQRRPLRVALTPAFAETWLIPRLPEFWSDHPDIQLDLAPSLKNVDLTAGNYDFAIRYGRGDWPGHDARFLVSADYTVVASPKLDRLSPLTSVGDLRDEVWLFEAEREEHRKWAKKQGLDFDSKRNRFYPNNSLVLSAVKAGHGYSLQSHALVATDLVTGALKAVFRERSEDLGYYLLSRPHSRADARAFSRWILKLDSGR